MTEIEMDSKNVKMAIICFTVIMCLCVLMECLKNHKEAEAQKARIEQLERENGSLRRMVIEMQKEK